MKAKSSAYYQREFRKRLRDQGLVKKEVWVLPQHAKALSSVEAKLRTTEGLSQLIGEGCMSEVNIAWTTASLLAALSKEKLIVDGKAGIELIDGVEPSLLIEMYEYGDLPIFISVAGEQILCESVLWSVDDVLDVNGLNEAILKTHKFLPLSTVSIESAKGLPDHYQMFGALSATSTLANVVLEVEVLAANVIQATEAYSEFLNFNIEETA